ncbi:polysaccharide deacetylase family protein [Streptomyces sp. NPDC058045]|uniref:polysaccharide deacetylase family protein n=1 Tax=Streptomyces sp. NPDC058045 TaxID=3346311 RepID=UPI0036E41AB1
MTTPPPPTDRSRPAPPPADRTTTRRTALRAGAGLAAAGLLTAGCATGRSAPAPPARPEAPGHPTTSAPRPAFTRTPPANGPHRFPGSPAQIGHGPRDRPLIALTFQGQGDPAPARKLLSAAERAGARVTVLAVGTWLDQHPEMARRILDGGHDLGNHTLHHQAVNELSEAGARAEITGCADRLRRLTGSIGSWFRPSRARYASPLVERLARTAGYPHLLSYDVDSLDHTAPGPQQIIDRVTGQARPGSVVSLHLGHEDTATALPGLLDALHRRGLRPVTATELLS